MMPLFTAPRCSTSKTGHLQRLGGSRLAFFLGDCTWPVNMITLSLQCRPSRWSFCSMQPWGRRNWLRGRTSPSCFVPGSSCKHGGPSWTSRACPLPRLREKYQAVGRPRLRARVPSGFDMFQGSGRPELLFNERNPMEEPWGTRRRKAGHIHTGALLAIHMCCYDSDVALVQGAERLFQVPERLGGVPALRSRQGPRRRSTLLQKFPSGLMLRIRDGKDFLQES